MSRSFPNFKLIFLQVADPVRASSQIQVILIDVLAYK
jgi:hypothetical protein